MSGKKPRKYRKKTRKYRTKKNYTKTGGGNHLDPILESFVMPREYKQKYADTNSSEHASSDYVKKEAERSIVISNQIKNETNPQKKKMLQFNSAFFSTERRLGPGHLDWSMEQDQKYSEQYTGRSTIVLFIGNTHGKSGKTLPPYSGLHWYSPIPTTESLIHADITPLMIQSKLKKMYIAHSIGQSCNIGVDYVCSVETINHMKVLQKFLNIKHVNNVRVLDILTDGYAINKPRNKNDYNYSDKIFPQRFWKLLRDKEYYMMREDHKSQEAFIAIMHISHPDDTILSQISSRKTYNFDDHYKYTIDKLNIIDTSNVFLLSNLLSKLKGDKPYKTYQGIKHFVEFDDIFIYDLSCNNNNSIKNSHLPLVDPEILPYDVDNHAQINCPSRIQSVYNTSRKSNALPSRLSVSKK
jgi:hypothetical protein